MVWARARVGIRCRVIVNEWVKFMVRVRVRASVRG